MDTMVLLKTTKVTRPLDNPNQRDSGYSFNILKVALATNFKISQTH